MNHYDAVVFVIIQISQFQCVAAVNTLSMNGSVIVHGSKFTQDAGM